MDNSEKNPLKTLEEKFPWLPKLFSDKKLIWILAVFLIFAGTFTNISSGSAIVIGLGIVLIILALIDPKTVKKLSSKWFSLERHEYSEEERQVVVQVGQKEISPEIKDKLNQIADEAKKRKDEERAPEDYLVLANEAWRGKKYEEGLALAYVGLHLEPKVPRTRAGLHTVLGLIYSGLKSYPLAEENYQKAIQLDQKISAHYNNLGSLYLNQKKYIEAEAAYQKALEIDSNFVDTHYNLGNLYSDQKQYAKAEAAYHKALELDPKDAGAHNNLGSLYAQLNRLPEAEDNINRALELDANEPIHHVSLGELYVKQEKLNEAEASFKKALELDPDLKEAQNNLEKVRKLRDEDKDSPAHPTLDLGKEKSKESSQ